MNYILKFIKQIGPDGLPYLWVNGYFFEWRNGCWVFTGK